LQRSFGFSGPSLAWKDYLFQLRHVDDTFAASARLCPDCLLALQRFALPDSIGFSVKGRKPSMTFLHLSLQFNQDELVVAPLSTNAHFALGLTDFQKQARIPPLALGGWSFSLLKSYVAGRLFTHLSVSRGGTPLELFLRLHADQLLLWELLRLGYTPRFLGRVLGSLSPRLANPGLTWLRRWLRDLLSKNPPSTLLRRGALPFLQTRTEGLHLLAPAAHLPAL